MKLQQMNGQQFFITLPNAIIRAKGWRKGDDIKVVIDGKGDIVLRKSKYLYPVLYILQAI